LALGLGFVLRVAMSFAPLQGLWGLDTLKPWPRPLAWAVVGFGALGFVPAAARPLERAMDGLGAFWERSDRWIDGLVAAGVGLSLLRLGDPVMFTGDFLTRVSQLILEAPTAIVFPQAAPLDRWINIELPRLLIRTQHMEVMSALHTVGAVVGAGFAFVTLRFVREAGASRGGRVAAAAMVLGGGYMLHFAGYDKFGPLLLGIALASYGAARLARDGRGAWALGLGISVALLAHRSGYALVPPAAWVLVQAWRQAARIRARLPLAAAAAAILATALALLPRAWRLLQTVDREQNLPGAPLGGGPAGVHGLADMVLRAGDALNLLFLIAPLWLAGLAAAWLARGAPPAAEDRRGFSLLPVAFVALVPELVLLVVVRGAQGVPRDWDMHVAPALVVVLLSVAFLAVVWRRCGAGSSLAPTLTTALASAVALWGIHRSEPLALERIDELLAVRGAWSDAAWARAHDFLGERALAHQPEVAVREFEAAIRAAPNPRFFFELGLAHRMLGHTDEARSRFEEAHRLDPLRSDSWVGFALLAMDAGDYRRVVACCESALVISPHRNDAKEMRASALRHLEEGAETATPSP
jgi:tetratricopeptide (TPR) repeat protein